MSSIIRILKYIPKTNKSNLIINDKYLIKKTMFDNYKYNYLCWKSRCISNMYIDEYSYNRKLFTLDFTITKDIIKIKHLSINSDYNDKNSKTYNNDNNRIKLKEEETTEIKKFVFYLIEEIATKNNINKVVIDIHTNLERYNNELKDEGFIANYDNKYYLNPNWIQAEKIIK